MGDSTRGSEHQSPADNVEEHQAQRQSDAPPDAGAGREGERLRGEDQRGGSTANGVPASDAADGELRRKQYRDGAELVSGMD
jgi:hypothetical protein